MYSSGFFCYNNSVSGVLENMDKCKCEKCSSREYIIIGANKINDPRNGLIKVEMRQCSECSHRYRVTVVSDEIETYYR